MRSRSALPALAVAVLGSLLPSPAWAAPGDLDPSFGDGGRVTTNFSRRNDLALGVAIQSDGRVVTAGTADFRRFALTRYSRNGRLDPSFGRNGRVTTRFTTGLTVAYAVAIEPDGKIVAAGSAEDENRFALARYNPDGTLDPSFGDDGRATTTFTGDHDFALDVAIQPDGKIVAAGISGLSRFAVVRFDADGSLDPSFGDEGKVRTDLADGLEAAFAVAIQRDGKIVVAGHATGGGGRFGLVRYEADGSLDASFGGDGKVRTNLTSRNDTARDIVIQPNGRIVVAGHASGAGGRFALTRYLPDGTLDRSFDGDGKVLTNLTRGRDLAFGIALQADRRIVAVGHAGGTRASARNHRFAFARYRPNGALDPTFGRDGKRLVDFTRGDDWATDVALQPDGRIVAAGRAAGAGGRFAVARLRAG